MYFLSKIEQKNVVRDSATTACSGKFRFSRYSPKWHYPITLLDFSNFNISIMVGLIRIDFLYGVIKP